MTINGAPISTLYISHADQDALAEVPPGYWFAMVGPGPPRWVPRPTRRPHPLRRTRRRTDW